MIVAVDGKPVRTRADLLRLVQAHEPGEEVRIAVKRGAKRGDGDDPRRRPIPRTATAP